MMGNKYAQNIVENTKAPPSLPWVSWFKCVQSIVENVKSENGGNAYPGRAAMMRSWSSGG